MKMTERIVIMIGSAMGMYGFIVDNMKIMIAGLCFWSVAMIREAILSRRDLDETTRK